MTSNLNPLKPLKNATNKAFKSDSARAPFCFALPLVVKMVYGGIGIAPSNFNWTLYVNEGSRRIRESCFSSVAKRVLANQQNLRLLLLKTMLFLFQ